MTLAVILILRSTQLQLAVISEMKTILNTKKTDLYISLCLIENQSLHETGDTSQ